MSNLKYRVGAIVALTLLALWTLFPRQVVERVRSPDGVLTYDTLQRVPLKRGLDLQGGMHLALEVDESKGVVANESEALDLALTVVRTRIDEFGVAEPIVQKVGDDRIIVELPGIDDQERAVQIVQKSAFLQFQIVDESQALERALPRIDQIVRDAGLAVAGAGDEAGGGLEPAGGIQDLFTPRGDSAVADSTAADSAPGMATIGPFSRLLQQGQMVGQYFVTEDNVPLAQRYIALPAVQAVIPPGKVLRWAADTTILGGEPYRALYVLDARPIITGDFLVDARPNTSPTEGTLVIFELNNAGGRRFQAETARHIQDFMAIVLDDHVMGVPPVIQGAIGTRGQITMGGRDLQAAQDLALVLRAGALPVPLRVVEVRQIGASLGKDSVRQGLRAGVIAVALVVVIMLVYYRFAGLLAVAGLGLYVLYTMGALAFFEAVLTLPGLAGFVLSVGIAVDANVLIFERIREELDQGKTVRTAIDEGFRHAMSAIIDSNVTTALTAAVLYQYGTGPVRGFAVTLLAGIAASMITAIFVVRTFFLLWLNRSRGARTLSI
ncbi:MAG: protein translocase subunit SecD [Gemmatimonadaceae bacterium]